MKLKEWKHDLQCVLEYQNIVRIINKLAQDKFQFKPPKTALMPSVAEYVSPIVSQPFPAPRVRSRERERDHEYEREREHERECERERDRERERERARERERPEAGWEQFRRAYVRLGNLPFECSKNEICELMEKLRLKITASFLANSALRTSNSSTAPRAASSKKPSFVSTPSPICPSPSPSPTEFLKSS